MNTYIIKENSSIPGPGTKISHATQLNQKIKQKQTQVTMEQGYSSPC